MTRMSYRSIGALLVMGFAVSTSPAPAQADSSNPFLEAVNICMTSKTMTQAETNLNAAGFFKLANLRIAAARQLPQLLLQSDHGTDNLPDQNTLITAVARRLLNSNDLFLTYKDWPGHIEVVQDSEQIQGVKVNASEICEIFSDEPLPSNIPSDFRSIDVSKGANGPLLTKGFVGPKSDQIVGLDSKALSESFGMPITLQSVASIMR